MDLNYRVEGKGESIVFIHGLSDNLNYWEVLSVRFKKDYKVVRFDLRGHGDSKLGDEDISIDLFSEDLYNLLGDLNIKKAHLVGFSLGGCVALDFTIKYPDMVSSLVLMSSFSHTTKEMDGIFRSWDNALSNSFEDFYDLILPMVLCSDVIDKHKDELEFLKSISSKTANTKAFRKAVSAIRDFDVSDKLKDIDVDCLILAGKCDVIFPVNVQKDLNQGIDNSRLIILDNVNHNLLVGESIGKVYDILNDFFKK